MSFAEKKIKVGMAGAGIVGSEVIRSFTQGIFAPYGIELKSVAVRDLSKPREIEISESTILTDNAETIVNDPDIDLFVELVGGNNEAKHFDFLSLANRKPLVTANKHFLAENLAEVLDLARQKHVSVGFEPAVCGTIPVIGPLRNYYRLQRVNSIRGIINGTTNYILTKVGQGMDFDSALLEAQALGYAEADPRGDLDGSDAVYKLSILASLVSGSHIKPERILKRGIYGISPEDMAFAAQYRGGYAIKMIASAQQIVGKWAVGVAPSLIPLSHPLAKIEGCTNAVTIESDLSKKVTMIGAGAGGEETAAAVNANILEAAEHIRNQTTGHLPFLSRTAALIDPMALESAGYIRAWLLDEKGTYAQNAAILADCGLSMKSILQRGEDYREIEGRKYTQDFITIHKARQSDISEGLSRLANSPTVHGDPFYLQIAD